MTNSNVPKPASPEVKELINLWNSSLNSFFLRVDVEDGPTPPEIVVNVLTQEDHVRGAKKDLSYLAQIMETATVEHIPLAKNEAGEWKPTDEGQKKLDESGEQDDLCTALNMTLLFVYSDFSALDALVEAWDKMSEEERQEVTKAFEVSADKDSDTEKGPIDSILTRRKTIGKDDDGQDVTHITFNVLSDSQETETKLKALQQEFVTLFKAGKISVQYKKEDEAQQS